MAATRPYYVYELIDPRDSAVFYIGKGKGNRHQHHQKEADGGKYGAKCKRIREISAAGLSYEVVIVREFRSEDAAYRFETRRIEKRGLENLTNIVPGGRQEWERKMADRESLSIQVMAMLARKTANFTRPMRFWFAGQWNEIALDVEMFHKRMIEIMFLRGLEWTIQQFARHGIKLEPSIVD